MPPLKDFVVERNRIHAEERKRIRSLTEKQNQQLPKLFAKGVAAFETATEGIVPNQFIVIGTDPRQLIYPGISMGKHDILHGDELRSELVVAQLRRRCVGATSELSIDFVIPRLGEPIDPTIDFYHIGNSGSLGYVSLDLSILEQKDCTIEEFAEIKSFALLSEEVLSCR
jgi:hypothetical protein